MPKKMMMPNPGMEPPVKKGKKPKKTTRGKKYNG